MTGRKPSPASIWSISSRADSRSETPLPEILCRSDPYAGSTREAEQMLTFPRKRVGRSGEHPQAGRHFPYYGWLAAFPASFCGIPSIHPSNKASIENVFVNFYSLYASKFKPTLPFLSSAKTFMQLCLA
jgi:hypothetical protein